MRDSARTREEKQDLEDLRRSFADSYWLGAQIPPVECAAEEWDIDGVYWSKRVFWCNEETSILGSFGIEFAPDSVEITDHWTQ